MNGGKRAGRKIENLVGFALHHLADALCFALRHRRQPGQMAFHFLDRLGQRGANLVRSADISPAARSSLSHSPIASPTSVRASCLAWAALSPIRVCAPVPASRNVPISAGQYRVGGVAGLFQALGLARESGGELAGAAGGIGHDQFQMALGIAGHHFKTLGFAAQANRSPVPCRCAAPPSALSNRALSSFSLFKSSFIWLRCFS